MASLPLGLTAAVLVAGLLALGVPVAVALGTVGFAGLWWTVDLNFALSMAQTVPFSVVSNYSWAVLPLFVLMGTIAAASGITEDLFRAANAWLARVRGGLYLAVISGSAVFAAASGSTVVNAVVFTRLALPRMIQYGYSRSLSLGCITAAGTFAAMIPPSLTMVIYAIMTEQSVGRLLLAGVIPGFLSAAAYGTVILVLVRVRPRLAPRVDVRAAPLAERLRSLRLVVPMVALIVLILGGIYTGSFAPSAAGAVGAAGAFVLALSRLRGRMWAMGQGFLNATEVSCTIFAILIGGQLFSRFLVAAGLVDGFVESISGLVSSQAGVLALLCAMYLVLGCLIDTASMMVVTLPFIYPLTQEFQIDPIWFGIVFVKLIEISVVTPPIGLNLYATMSAAREHASFGDLVVGILPFLLTDVVTLALLLCFPQLSTWLPGHLPGG
jgi:tripartite ATP-independent transporter DctM subunit